MRDTFDFMHDNNDRSGARIGNDDTIDEESVTLTLVVHGDVGQCIKVSMEGDDKKTVLLPHSQIQMRATGRHTERVGHPKYAIVDVTIPEWLAKDRGLV